MENTNALNNFNIFVGAIIVILSLIVMIFGAATLITLILLISFVFIFVGFGRIFNGLTNESLSKISKVFKHITGILSIVISITLISISFSNPDFAILIFTNLFGYLLAFIGISRIIVGYRLEIITKQYRIAVILIGAITLTFAILILIFPTLGYFILVMLISLSLLLNGLTRVLIGLLSAKS